MIRPPAALPAALQRPLPARPWLRGVPKRDRMSGTRPHEGAGYRAEACATPRRGGVEDRVPERGAWDRPRRQTLADDPVMGTLCGGAPSELRLFPAGLPQLLNPRLLRIAPTSEVERRFVLLDEPLLQNCAVTVEGMDRAPEAASHPRAQAPFAIAAKAVAFMVCLRAARRSRFGGQAQFRLE